MMFASAISGSILKGFEIGCSVSFAVVKSVQRYNHELSLFCFSFIFNRSEFSETISWTRE